MHKALGSIASTTLTKGRGGARRRSGGLHLAQHSELPSSLLDGHGLGNEACLSKGSPRVASGFGDPLLGKGASPALAPEELGLRQQEFIVHQALGKERRSK